MIDILNSDLIVRIMEIMSVFIPARHSISDDKPQAKISPLQPSPQHSQHHSRVPDLEQSRDEYVDLLKMKYGI